MRIIGNIKTFQNKRTVTAGHIRAITDFNEVFYHKLDAVHTHLQITRGPGAAGGAGAGAGAVSGGRERRKAHISDLGIAGANGRQVRRTKGVESSTMLWVRLRSRCSGQSCRSFSAFAAQTITTACQFP